MGNRIRAEEGTALTAQGVSGVRIGSKPPIGSFCGVAALALAATCKERLRTDLVSWRAGRIQVYAKALVVQEGSPEASFGLR